MSKTYALIKNNKVFDLIVFDDPSEKLLEQFKEHHKADAIVLATSKAMIQGEWDGTDFITVSPYPSWVLNSTKDWVAPISYPTDGAVYYWNEEITNWTKASVQQDI